ncbi:uncharacterized protein IWZ02DRAFT_460139, partial [Phyllosticta citriasiana]|uniref:uncharacterized protein n=1 Tax=Phyllosticta citriasiana TaxID=595635 RepID=UPI0030FD5174
MLPRRPPFEALAVEPSWCSLARARSLCCPTFVTSLPPTVWPSTAADCARLVIDPPTCNNAAPRLPLCRKLATGVDCGEYAALISRIIVACPPPAQLRRLRSAPVHPCAKSIATAGKAPTRMDKGAVSLWPFYSLLLPCAPLRWRLSGSFHGATVPLPSFCGASALMPHGNRPEAAALRWPFIKSPRISLSRTRDHDGYCAYDEIRAFGAAQCDGELRETVRSPRQRLSLVGQQTVFTGAPACVSRCDL